MSEPFDNSKPKTIHGNRENPIEKLQKKAPHLRLVVSNPPPVEKKSPPQTTNQNAGLIAEIKMKNPSHYILAARDPFHRLNCELSLEIHDNEEEEELEPRSVVCHFPDILDGELNDFVDGDETLLGMILIQFQMKLLEQVLLFCSDHDALNLVIYTNDTPEGHALGIYEHLVAYEDKIPAIYNIPTKTGTKIQMVIPTNQETFDKLVDLMDQTKHDFRQALWAEQRTNPSIREYIRLNPGLNFSG